MYKQGKHHAMAVTAVVGILAIMGLVLLFKDSAKPGLTGAVAADEACMQLNDLFHDAFDCCASGSGAKKCTGLQTASEASGCGTLSCGVTCPCFAPGEIAAATLTNVQFGESPGFVACGADGFPLGYAFGAGIDENTANYCVNFYAEPDVEFRPLSAEQYAVCQNLIRTECAR